MKPFATGAITGVRADELESAVGEEAPEPASPPGKPGGSRRVVLGLLALIALSALLKLDYQAQHFWIDEGLSVGIASHPLSEIPQVLRQDGSPPLYYMILNLWIGVFGDGERATHVLSLLFALATVPAAFWGGLTLFDRKAGWIAASLAATNPYLALYSGETRMYTLVVLEAMVATVAFLHVFVLGNRRYLPAFVVSLTLLLYTHSWGLFFTLGAGFALLPCWIWARNRRQVVVDAAIGFGAVAVLHAPWVPTLLYQATHTAAPWSSKPIIRELVSGVGFVLGDERVLVALILAGGAAIISRLLQPEIPEGRLVWTAGTLFGGILLTGWVYSQFNPAWAPRYFGAFLPPVFLISALGLSRGGKQGLVAMGLIMLFWVQPLGRITGTRSVDPDRKGLAKPMAEQIKPVLQKGDVLIGMQLEELPVLYYYFPKDLKYATAFGPTEHPELVDWRDAVDRMKASNAATGLVPMIDDAPTGTQFLLLCPWNIPDPDTKQVWFRLMYSRCSEWKKTLAADSRMAEQDIPELGTTNDTRHLPRYVKLYKKVAD